MKKTKLNYTTILTELSNDLETTHQFAIDTRTDLLLGEATLAEYGTYVRFCLKRVNLIIKAIENLKVSDKIEFIDLLNEANELKTSLLKMKAHAGTQKDITASITCNAILKSFMERYTKYISINDIQEIINL